MNAAIILAGGKGERFGASIPKQFIKLGNKPIIEHTLDAFYIHPHIDLICITLPIARITTFEKKIKIHYPSKKIIAVAGGQSRQESTANGLRGLATFLDKEDIVLIHDAVRPFISQRIINENIILAKKYHAIDTVIPSADTIVESQDQKNISQIPPRKNYYLGQTPQSFQFGLIWQLYQTLTKEELSSVTDDASLLINNKVPVYIAKGDPLNFKITTSWDLTVADAILKTSPTILEGSEYD